METVVYAFAAIGAIAAGASVLVALCCLEMHASGNQAEQDTEGRSP